MTHLSCTSCGSLSKRMSIWWQRKPSPSTSDVLRSKIYPLVFPCRLLTVSSPPRQQFAAQRHGQLECAYFGPQHHLPAWTALPTWVLLDSQCIKRQGCQTSVRGTSSLCCTHMTLQFNNTERAGFSNPHAETCSWSLGMVAILAWWPAKLTCVSQVQQVQWAYCLLHVLCKSMEHFYLNHVCLF